MERRVMVHEIQAISRWFDEVIFNYIFRKANVVAHGLMLWLILLLLSLVEECGK